MPDRKPNMIERVGLRLAGNYVREAVGDLIDSDELFYRRITDTKRDLNPVSHQRAQDIALHLYRTNPVAHRFTEMLVDYVVGADGLKIEATSQDDTARELVQEVIDEFWADPRSNLKLRHRDIVRDLGIYGEMSLRRFVNPTSGRSRIGIIDVARIRDVLPDKDDLLVDAQLTEMKPGEQDVTWNCVVWDDITDPANPQWKGDVFYFAVNRVIGQHRGTPDLFAIADWVDGYDQLLFNSMERTALINAFIYDVTIKGADKTAIEEWMRQHREPPRPGTVQVHNEDETWQAVNPQLNNADVMAIGTAVKNMAIGGAGMPESWFADGSRTNRATLAEQSDPTYRMLQSRQEYIADCFRKVIATVIQGQVGFKIPTGTDTDFRILMPELSSKDMAALSTALPLVTQALDSAIVDQLISTQSARSVFLSVASQLGVELDADEEESLIEDEQADKAAAEQQQAIDMAKALAASGNPANGNAGPGPGGKQPPMAPALDDGKINGLPPSVGGTLTSQQGA